MVKSSKGRQNKKASTATGAVSFGSATASGGRDCRAEHVGGVSIPDTLDNMVDRRMRPCHIVSSADNMGRRGSAQPSVHVMDVPV